MKFEKLTELIDERITGEWGQEPISSGVKVIRTTNFTNEGKLDLTNVVERDIEEKKVEKKSLRKGDIIIEKSGGGPTQPVGRVVFFDIDSDEKYLCNNFTTILRPKSGLVYSKYLLYQMLYLHKVGKTKKYQNKTTGIHNLNLDKYLQEKVPLPPLPDQLHIANLLSKAENLIAQRKASIRLLDEFLKSTFLEMFGDPGINPKKWPVRKLEEFIEYMGDIGSNGSNEMVAKNLEMLDEEDYAIMIRTTNLTRNDFTNNIKYVTQKTYEFFKKSKIYGGEIIMNKIGSAGDFWLMPNLNRPVTLGLNQLVIRPKNIPTLYLFHYLSTDYGRMIVKAQAKGATTKSITKTAVKALPLMYPPVELQNKFVGIVEKTESLKTQYQQSLQELKKLYGSLSQKAFRGELGLKQLAKS